MLEACKYKDGESERTHSKAMSIGDMTKLYDYAMTQYLGLESSAAQRGSFLLFIALSSTAYTLWTRYVDSDQLFLKRYQLLTQIFRNCETTSLTLGDFHLAVGLRDERRVRGNSEPSTNQFTHFKVKLRNRKNWQKCMKNGDQQTSG